MKRKQNKPTEYILGICPYKTQYVEVIFKVSGQNPIPWNVKENLKFANNFRGYEKRCVA